MFIFLMRIAIKSSIRVASLIALHFNYARQDFARLGRKTAIPSEKTLTGGEWNQEVLTVGSRACLDCRTPSVPEARAIAYKA